MELAAKVVYCYTWGLPSRTKLGIINKRVSSAYGVSVVLL